MNGLCERCGEPAHVYFCPKPHDIPADVWREMDDDARLAAERAAPVGPPVLPLEGAIEDVLVQTNYDRGLCDSDVERVVRILKPQR